MAESAPAQSITLPDLLAALAQRQSPAPAPVANGFQAFQPQQQPFAFGTPIAAAPLQPTGVLVPLSLNLPDGREMTVQLMFGPEAAANPQAFLQGVLATYGAMLKAYHPRNNNGGGGWGGNGGGGGWGNRGGRRW